MDVSNNWIFAFLISLEILFGLAASFLLYKIKLTLTKEGYRITWSYGGLFDLVLLFRLYLKKKENKYLYWLLLFLFFSICFLIILKLLLFS
jgi:phosphotransferase system  glucose/maltose/N-acetylglucosamine-specific IIC component